MELNGNGQITEYDERAFDFSTSDFAKLLKLKSFVDKTLMIRDMFGESSRILVTAPPRFGKSTNIDMIKRFLEIEVDIQCTPKPVYTTKNYKLFQDNNLVICKHEEFFNEHFGKYPVIHLDLQPLSDVRDFAETLDAIKSIIRKSFNQHSYLSNEDNSKIVSSWVRGFDIDDFKKHLSSRLLKDVDAADLAHSLEYLSIILHKHFRKEVFVLIDNYDAFIKSTISRNYNNEDPERIISFITATIDNLLKNNKCVEQALLTGVLPVTGDKSFFNNYYIMCYSFMGNHPLCKYFGLTSDELDNVLGKLVLDDDERRKTKLTIDEFYSGYSTENGSVQVYNIWSALQYVCRREVQNYRVYIEPFKPLFRNFLFMYDTALALLDEDTELDISQTLSIKDILELSEIITSEDIEDSPFPIANKIIYLLYHFGYFSIKNVLAKKLVSLQLTNESIKYELANVHIRNTQVYCDSYVLINKVWFSIESFRPEQTDQDAPFKTFSKLINAWYQEVFPEEISDISFILFTIILAQSKYNKTLLLSSGTGTNSFSRILLKNKHEVIICITISCSSDSSAPAETLMSCAEISHKKITALGLETVFNTYTQFRNKVIIAIASNLRSSGVCIAYSDNFCERHSLENYKTLAVGFHT